MICEYVKLGKVCDILDTLRKPITKKFRKEGQYPYYGATGIVDYSVIYENNVILTENIKKKVTYNNIQDKFELSKFKENVVRNISNNISNEILISISRINK